MHCKLTSRLAQVCTWAVLALVVFCVLAVPVTSEDAAAAAAAPAPEGKGHFLKTLAKRASEDLGQCKWQGQKCNPWKSECCPGSVCQNHARSYCAYGFEPCICYPAVRYDIY